MGCISPSSPICSPPTLPSKKKKKNLFTRDFQILPATIRLLVEIGFVQGCNQTLQWFETLGSMYVPAHNHIFPVTLGSTLEKETGGLFLLASSALIVSRMVQPVVNLVCVCYQFVSKSDTTVVLERGPSCCMLPWCIIMRVEQTGEEAKQMLWLTSYCTGIFLSLPKCTLSFSDTA